MSHLSMLEIDAIAAGHSPLHPHVEACDRCRADLETARAACAQFTRDVYPRTVDKLRRRRPWWPALIVPVLAAAAVMLWLGREQKPDPDLRIKGDITYQVFAKRDAQIIQVRDGTHLRPGDQIRFVAGSTTARYLMIGSIDGAGHATLYYPYGGPRSTAIDKLPAELPGSIVLDTAPGPERLFALFSAEPLEGADVIRALTRIKDIRGTTTLDIAAKQATIMFEKDVP
jgi:hypothetical protein